MTINKFMVLQDDGSGVPSEKAAYYNTDSFSIGVIADEVIEDGEKCTVKLKSLSFLKKDAIFNVVQKIKFTIYKKDKENNEFVPLQEDITVTLDTEQGKTKIYDLTPLETETETENGTRTHIKTTETVLDESEYKIVYKLLKSNNVVVEDNKIFQFQGKVTFNKKGERYVTEITQDNVTYKIRDLETEENLLTKIAYLQNQITQLQAADTLLSNRIALLENKQYTMREQQLWQRSDGMFTESLPKTIELDYSPTNNTQIIITGYNNDGSRTLQTFLNFGESKNTSIDNLIQIRYNGNKTITLYFTSNQPVISGAQIIAKYISE